MGRGLNTVSLPSMMASGFSWAIRLSPEISARNGTPFSA